MFKGIKYKQLEPWISDSMFQILGVRRGDVVVVQSSSVLSTQASLTVEKPSAFGSRGSSSTSPRGRKY